MSKVLLLGATFSKNKGSEAMLVSTIKSIRECIENSDFILLSIFPDEDSKKAVEYDVKVSKYSTSVLNYLGNILLSFFYYVLNKLKFDTNEMILNAFLKKFKESDIILDLSGDGFSDDYGVIETLASCYDILLCKLLNKPIVIFAQSIGPFNTILTKKLSKFFLNRVDILIVREKISRDYLMSIGINNKIYLTADSAFLLKPEKSSVINQIASNEGLNLNKKHIVGISVSQLIFELDRNPKHSNSYIELMAYLADYLVEKYSANIVFIPHVTSNSIDDRFVSREIYNLVVNKDNMVLIDGEYSAEETKGIISKCDLFIGARMHANIAATSMHVPTLAISYSHKFYGIMEMLDVDDYVYDFHEINKENITAKIDLLWNNRFEIKKTLEYNVRKLKKCAFQNIELVDEFLNVNNKK
ncbi:polysaccharide pyruvyl transferase family protein [Methanobacterium sp.]|uniref:polysaccharide pyruvyl transferase family protein n=1 Tax=Methanobacterium sp. TaxID=2164 RepID=UPI0031598CFE